MTPQKILFDIIAPIIVYAFAIFLAGGILITFVDHYTGIFTDASIHRKMKKGLVEVITADEYLALAKEYPKKYGLDIYSLKNVYYFGKVNDYVRIFHKDAKRLYQGALQKEQDQKIALQEKIAYDSRCQINKIRSQKEAS